MSEIHYGALAGSVWENHAGGMENAVYGKNQRKTGNGSAIFVETKERKLSKQEEMLQFQKEFWDEVARIPKTPTIDRLAIHVTDAGWKRMKEEPQYRKEMMDLIRRDITGNFIFQVNCAIKIDNTRSKYQAQSWSADRNDSARSREEAVRRRRKKHKEYQKLVEAMRMRHKFLYAQGEQAQEQRRVEPGQNETAPTVEISAKVMSAFASYEANIPFAP